MQSVFHVAYLRGLFPDDVFKGVHMANLDNMDLMMLQPLNDETSRMISWLDQDVNLALTKGYLHRLHFCVTEDPEGQKLIEQYSYTFTYSSAGMSPHNMRTARPKYSNDEHDRCDCILCMHARHSIERQYKNCRTI